MTQIIVTLGPATSSLQRIKELVNVGVGCFRLNFSHGEYDWHKKMIENIRSIDSSIPIMLDTKGPEMRTGDFDGKMTLKKDEWLTLTVIKEDQDINKNKLFVNHSNLINDVVVGDFISLDSGLIELEVLEIQKTQIITRLLHSGEITSRRHVNLIQKDVSLPTLTDRDIQDIAFGLQNGVDIIALSFIRSAHGIEMTKDLIKKSGAKNVKIFGKIESQLGIDNLDEIAKNADGLMVARGDLGVETPLEEVPEKQKKILNAGKKNNIPVIVATEMLESMIEHPRPTRAEVSDIALAVWQNADFVMLSGETAAGKYPIIAVKTMKKVIDSAQKNKSLL